LEREFEKDENALPLLLISTQKVDTPWWILRPLAWLNFGQSYYGYYGPRTVRIGPNTIVKFGTSVGPEELEAMRYISENTTIPISQGLRSMVHPKSRRH
jgi:hypothetical protein